MLVACLLATVGSSSGPTQSSWSTQPLIAGFSVNAPVTLHQRTVTKVDKAFSQSRIWIGGDHDGVFVVEASVLKDPRAVEVGKLMSGTVAGFLSFKGAQLVEERDMTLNGWPEIAATSRDPDGTVITMRFVVTRKFCAQCSYTRRPGAKQVERARLFLNSLSTPSSEGTGPLKADGAQLTRFPLGDTGISALFPEQPDRTVEPATPGSRFGPTTVYEATYATREFVVRYKEFPAPVAKALAANDQGMRFLLEDVARDLNGVAVRERTAREGGYTVFQADVETGGANFARLAELVDGARLINLMVFEPKPYVEGPAIDRFLHGLKFRSR